MESITEGATLVAGAIENNGETNTMLGVATTWLGNEHQAAAERYGPDASIVGRLAAARGQAEEAQAAISAAGAALEAFAEALEACGE